MKESIAYILICICLAGIIGTVWYKTSRLGSKSSHYKEVCIQGHTYYRANFMGKMGLTIKLDDDGRPVKCQINK